MLALEDSHGFNMNEDRGALDTGEGLAELLWFVLVNSGQVRVDECRSVTIFNEEHNYLIMVMGMHRKTTKSFQQPGNHASNL